MTTQGTNAAQSRTVDRYEIRRRAELLRAEVTFRFILAVSRRVRNAFARVTGRREPVEHVCIPRSPSNVIF